MSNAARDWAGMSDAEKELAIERQAYGLLSLIGLVTSGD